MNTKSLSKRATFIAIVLFVVTVFMLFSCNKKSRDNATSESGKSSNTSLTKGESQTNRITSKVDKVVNEQNSLLVKSVYKDGEYYLNGDLIDKLAFEQEILFLFEDNVLKKFDYPVQSLTIDTGGTNLVKIQENIITSISVVTGKKGWIYRVCGAGVLPNQTEFYGLYSPVGELLWYSYTTYQNFKKTQPGFPDEGYGDLDSVLEAYKITESEFNQPQKTVHLW